MSEQKEVYQLDGAGFYVGTSTADRLIDGTWQLPAGCVERKPPMARKGYCQNWDGKHWRQVPR